MAKESTTSDPSTGLNSGTNSGSNSGLQSGPISGAPADLSPTFASHAIGDATTETAKITAEFAPDQPFLAYLRAALEACDGASQILRHHFGRLHAIEEKFQAGLVSEADKNSEAFIVDLLASRFPDHAFLGEESGFSSAEASEAKNDSGSADAARKSGPPERAKLTPTAGRDSSSRPLWIIDPLDGTTNYVHQFPYFCISIGLEIEGQIVAAVVDAPMLRLRYYAMRGAGAYLNGRRLHASSRTQMKEALFATGLSGSDHALDQQLALCEKLIRSSRGLRRAGSAALDLCAVAQGVFDAYWEKGLSAWDTAAGILIAEEAGAVVTTMSNEPYNPRDKSILCATRAIHPELIQAMRQFKLGLVERPVKTLT